jgi:hypothetical protein
MTAEAPQILQTSAEVGGDGTSRTPHAERIGNAIRLVAPGVIEVGALAALAYGCWLAWPPFGFIVPGAIISALSIYADLRRSAATRAAGETKP